MKEKLRKPLTALMMAWGTYLAIPCPYKVWDDALRPWQIVCLPPVGLVVGGIWALCAGIFAKLGFTGFLAAAILAAVPFLVTGFFHLDGFLDCCDAILSRRDLATRQKILKDSRVGAFAVVSAVLLFLLSFAALADCSFSLIWRALLLIPVVTRCMAGVAVETFAPMQTSQYAGSFAAGKTKTQRRILLGMYIAVMLVVFLWLFSKPSCALAVAWAGLTTILACRLARRNLGGMSGDIAGFSITLGELSGLLILAMGISQTPGMSRIVRSAVLGIIGQEYIEAAKAFANLGKMFAIR